ncbi:hypothetical protein CNMCM6936_009538 [Aspergillus lentulus]|uniref:Enoyl reductase (ER) domain-containing protein n=1 Tax=Aspergillus lentulus TaxID=293939 RepID=A0AAN6BNG2_ASPLE|nr:hypothetical protein CNMCM6069_000300 [Aspergillus lentulus]KAF4164102.1 hypothetical protein CNMCM6936_009538 [Aspergillus lentulus]KAF4171343.1 hypothetical protein CNMCM8060_003093 [Aspergillus lentulus]KAF4181205.1 hypothetical protein CNMCM7927_000771 [Aspergillus lentulus]KAF4192592.1 hypothetical protein CNMCM8694_000203 [Aspergillus lentulus]
MTTVSTYVRVSSLEEPLFHHHLSVAKTPEPTTTHRSGIASATKQHKKTKQSALLLKGIGEPYTLVADHDVPTVSHKDEILVKIMAIGLNPIDWKGPAYNFGIPTLPWINGRDLVGEVIQVSYGCSRLRVGDIVLVPSTDYRDIRKAAFQEYAVATHFNAARIPPTGNIQASASLGVAFVAAALALGVSFGLDFDHIRRCPGPDLPGTLLQIDRQELPTDITDECFRSSSNAERTTPGDWLVIWGASTTTGYITLQLAKLAGLRVICVADVARHGAKLLDAGADLLVDRHDTARAVDIIRGVTRKKLRYAIDIVGKDTATLLQQTLDATVHDDGSHAHLLGLTGLPKERDSSIIYHTVPIKLFHSSPAVGEAMVTWLEELLRTETLRLPEIILAEGGLEGVNASLEDLRQGKASGKRIVTNLGR